MMGKNLLLWQFPDGQSQARLIKDRKFKVVKEKSVYSPQGKPVECGQLSPRKCGCCLPLIGPHDGMNLHSEQENKALL